LEEQQRALLAQMKRSSAAPPAPSTPPVQAEPEPAPEISGRDLATRALANFRRQAQIARDIDDYNKRPRKQFIGARASEYRFAQYAEEWRQKVERIGNLNYPAEARGKVYGSLQLSVSIRYDGSIDSIDIMRPSGHPILDRAAERIVRMGAP